MKIKDIKHSALDRINECYPQTLIVMLIFLGTHFFFTFVEIGAIQLLDALGYESDFVNLNIPTALWIVTAIRVIGEMVIIFPINIGVSWWLIHCARGENNNIKHIFICFSNGHIYLKSLILRMVINLVKLFAAIPGALCAYMLYVLLAAAMESDDGGRYTALIVCSAILLVCVTVLYAWLLLSLCLVNFLFALNPDKNIFKTISLSVEAMKRHKFEVVRYICSLLGWVLSLIFIIPAFFVLPYAAMGYGKLMDSIIYREININQTELLKKNYVSAR